jgi:hypothetical protein
MNHHLLLIGLMAMLAKNQVLHLKELMPAVQVIHLFQQLN